MKEVNYMNDILVATKTIDEYRAKIRRILRILTETEMRAKLSKCEFEKEKITFLKHYIDRNGICLMKEKLQILKEWKKSIKVKEVQVFIEFVNFYRKFIL